MRARAALMPRMSIAAPRLSALLFVLLLAACGPNGGAQTHEAHSDAPSSTASGSSNAQPDAHDEDDASNGDEADNDSGSSSDDAQRKAEDQAATELEDQSYEDVRGSDECTEDCSGHDAGWDWAKQHQIYDPDVCSGDSDSFIDGCKAYAEEIQNRAGDPQ